MNRLALTLTLLITCFSFITCNGCNGIKTEQMQEEEQNKEHAEQQSAFARLKAKADSAMLFCKQKGFSQEYCILVDFSIHSGKNRFFVWDFAKDTIKYESVCCHGYGKESTQKTPVFSNAEGSY